MAIFDWARTASIALLLLQVRLAHAQPPTANPVPAPVPTPPAPPTAYTPPPVATPAAPPTAPTAPWSAPPPLPPGYPALSPGYPALSPVYQPGILVDLRSSNPDVQLERVLDGGASVPICRAPCRVVLPGHHVYVIKGDGIVSTSKFSLPAGYQEVTLNVDAGSTNRRVGGAVLALAGFGLMMYVGEASEGGGDNRENVAGALALGGLGAAIVGVVLVLSTRTTVSSSSGRSFTEAPPAKRGKTRAFAFTARGLEF